MDSESPVSSAERAPGTRRRFVRQALGAALLGAALIHPAATLVARLDWHADLVTHFREPAVAITLIAAAGLARRRPQVAVALGCLAIFQAAPLFRYAGSNPVLPDAGSPERLRVLMANVLADNVRYEDLVRLIRRERPDIVGLEELTPEWVAGLAAIRAEYPHRVELPIGATGMALWFRDRPEVIDPPRQPLAGGSPFLHAEFRFAGRPCHLWLVHPLMPLSRRALPELPALATLIGRTQGSRIVIGDLNSTDGSPLFSDFLLATGLRDSRLGFGRQPSWPTILPYRIPLEHAFVSDDLAVVARRLGPSIGSDHFPLIIDLAQAAGTLEATRRASHSGAGPGRGG